MEQAAHLDRGRGRPRGGTYTRVLLVGNVATAQRGFTVVLGHASAHSIPTIGGVLPLKHTHNRRGPNPEAAVDPWHLGQE